MTIQDASDLTGTIVYDCRPPILPVSLRLKDIGLLPLRRPVASASLAAPPPELGVAPSDDRETDLEDELPTPEVSMFIGDSSP